MTEAHAPIVAMTEAHERKMQTAFIDMVGRATTIAAESHATMVSTMRPPYPRVELKGRFCHAKPDRTTSDGLSVPVEDITMRLQIQMQGNETKIKFEAFPMRSLRLDPSFPVVTSPTGDKEVILQLTPVFDSYTELVMKVDNGITRHIKREGKDKKIKGISAVFDTDEKGSRHLTILMRYIFRHYTSSVKAYTAIEEIAEFVCKEDRNVERTYQPVYDNNAELIEDVHTIRLKSGPIDVTLSLWHDEGNQRIALNAYPTEKMRHLRVEWNSEKKLFEINLNPTKVTIHVFDRKTNNYTKKYDAQEFPLNDSTEIVVGEDYRNKALFMHLIKFILRPYNQPEDDQEDDAASVCTQPEYDAIGDDAY